MAERDTQWTGGNPAKRVARRIRTVGASYGTISERRGVMFKGVVVGIALTLAVTLIGAFALLRSGLIPANADAAPGRQETWMAGTSLDATLRRDAPKGENPVPLTDMNLFLGVPLFSRHCVACHGAAKGVASPSPIAQGMRSEEHTSELQSLRHLV